MRKETSRNWWKAFKQDKGIYLSSFASYILVLILPLLVAVLLYGISTADARGAAISLNNQVLVSASERLEQHIDEIEDLTHIVVMNPTVRAFQNNTAGFSYPHSYRMNEVRSSLGGYSQIQSFISEYILLFNNSQIALNDTLIYKYEDFFDDYLRFAPEVHTQRVEHLLQRRLQVGLNPVQSMTFLKTQGEYLSYISPLYDQGNGYLIFFIKQEQVDRLFDNISLGEDGAIYIMNNDGVLVTSTRAALCDFDTLYQQTARQVLENMGEGSFTISTANGDMLVNYLSSGGLRYVSVQPMSVILNRTEAVRVGMLICLGTVVLLGVGLCLYQAKRITTPLSSVLATVGLHPDDSASALKAVEDIVLTLQADNRHLTHLASEHRTLLRASFTSRLLRGNFASPNEAYRICQYVFPGCERFDTACVLLIQLCPEEDLESSDAQLKLLGSMKVALKEIFDRLLDQPPYYDMDEETLALIVFNHGRNMMEALYQRVYEACPPSMRSCIRAYAGDLVTDSLPSIARSFETANASLNALQNDYAPERIGLIWPDAQTRSVQYFYPPDVSYRLMDAIAHGNGQLVSDSLEELFRVNFAEMAVTTDAGKLFMAELLGDVLRSTSALTAHDQETVRMLDQCLASVGRKPDERQLALFRTYFMRLAACAEQMVSAQGAVQIGQVIGYLQEHFCDSDLSLASIAEVFRMNPSMLSTEFKQQTGKNLSAYIEDMRIQEAQRLLRTTDKTINMIAEEVGYLSANTFCRAFRRNTGYNSSTYKSMTRQTGEQEQES